MSGDGRFWCGRSQNVSTSRACERRKCKKLTPLYLSGLHISDSGLANSLSERLTFRDTIRVRGLTIPAHGLTLCAHRACKHPPRLRYSKNTIKPYNNYGMCCSCHPSPCMLCPFTLIESAVALIPIRRTFFATGEHKPIGEQLDC